MATTPKKKHTPPAEDPVRQAHAAAQQAANTRLAALITRASKRASKRKPASTGKAKPAQQTQAKAQAQPDINGDDDLTRAMGRIANRHGITEDHIRAMIGEHLPSNNRAKGKATKKKNAA